MTSQNYSDLTFSVKDMQRFLKDGNISVKKSDLKKLDTIFNTYDKVNKNGEQKPDGELGQDEDRAAFMKDLKKHAPGLYDNLLEFFVMIDLIEDKRALENVKKSSNFDTKS